ncbi:MAG: adenosine kinase [Gammaproteobacteria bacterium]
MIKYDIVGIGNALVDTQFKVTLRLIDDLGLKIDQMTLSSSEEHAPIITKLLEEKAESVSDCGGSATNSLVAASMFGATCFHNCKIADDDDGHRYLKSLNDTGVHHSGKMSDPTVLPTGKCLILVTPDAKRTMLTALNVSAAMNKHDIVKESITAAKIFYMEGYMVSSNENYDALNAAIEASKSNPNLLKVFSLSDPGIVNIFRERFKEVENHGLDLILCNAEEAIAFTETSSLEDAISILKAKPYKSAITTGAGGCWIVDGLQVTQVPGVKINPVDTNGAGDMFAGCFMYALLNNCSLEECGKFANYGASKVVETFGPRLDAAGYAEVRKNFKKN